MNIKWITNDQQMTFVGPGGTAVNPLSLAQGITYQVFMTLGNLGPKALTNVIVQVQHGSFGIGLPAGYNDGTLTQPPSLAFLPPPASGTDIPGEGIVSFTFTEPAGGPHGCLTATVISATEDVANAMPQTPTSPVVLSQNTQGKDGAIGNSMQYSFGMYGSQLNPGIEAMQLQLTESVVIGNNPPSLVTPGQSWKHELVIPAGILKGSQGDTYQLSLPQNSYYPAIVLQVTPGSDGPHIFHIAGSIDTDGDGVFETSVGSVDIIVNPVSAKNYNAPAPYVNGGYQSFDVRLSQSKKQLNMDVPLGSKLRPNTNYSFSAIVHNSGQAEAVNTVVRFWSFESGAGSAGALLDIQLANIPAATGGVPGQRRVWSKVPFRSAPSGQHRCAVVSIYNAEANPATAPDAVTARDVVNPNLDLTHSSSAWRNTDSLIINLKKPFIFPLGVQWPPIHGPGPDPDSILVEIESQYVPLAWQQSAQVKQIENKLRKAGGDVGNPVFLLSEYRSKFASADLNVNLTSKDGKLQIKNDKKNSNAFQVCADASAAANFVISGQTPSSAKPGDIFLVNVTAHYPQWRNIPARDIEFLEVLYVGKK